ncbi:MAG: hypothetical protein JW832_15855 [Deltaproteobacteria bacterium]|nr:hypothetical protein [Deltaproteobacteria bacterium]
MMNALALVVSIIALIAACMAYKKSGGSVDDLKRKIDDLHLSTENLRSKMADSLEKIEKKVRGDEKKSDDQSS